MPRFEEAKGVQQDAFFNALKSEYLYFEWMCQQPQEWLREQSERPDTVGILCGWALCDI